MEDFHALADGHTKAITTVLEEFNEDQMMLRIEAEQALNDKSPVDDDGPTKPDISTSPNLHSTKQLVEGSNDIRLDRVTITEQAEGIFYILTED